MGIALIWGSTFIIIKNVVDTFEPITFVFLRFLVASVFMLFATVPLWKRVNKQFIIDGSILGFVLFIIFLFQTLALKLSSATEVGFLTGLYILFVPILSAVVLRKFPHPFSWFGVALSAVGMMLVTYQTNSGISLGQIFAIINAFFIGVQILLTDVYSRRHNVFLLTAIQISVVCILSGVYALLFESADFSMVTKPAVAYPIIFTGIIATVVCFYVQTAMQKHTTPTKAGIMFTFEPLSSAFFSFLIAGELLSMRQYFGAGLIICAILIAEVGTALKHAKNKVA